MGTWYLGPIGALVAIPAPAADLDVSPQLIGAMSTSLSGARTLYRTSQPRQWACQWQALTEDQTTYLRAVGYGLVQGPLRLIDPEIRNRLPVHAASGGSYQRYPYPFVGQHSPVPTWVAVGDPPATVPVRGAISWQTNSVDGSPVSLAISGTDTQVPLIPGEQVVVSGWVRGASMLAAMGLDAQDINGVVTRTVGTAVTLNSVAWTYLSVTYTPPSSVVSLSPVLVPSVGQPTATLQTTGWQVAPATASTTWTVGDGAPTVLAGSALTTGSGSSGSSGLTEQYLMPGLRSFTLLLIQAWM